MVKGSPPSRRRFAISLAGIAVVLGILSQATDLGEKIARWFGDDEDSGRITGVDLASSVGISRAAESVSPVRECFELSARPKLTVRGIPWPPMAAVSVLGQVAPTTIPSPTPTTSVPPTPTPTSSPTATPTTGARFTGPRLDTRRGPVTVEFEGDDIKIAVQPRSTPTPTPADGPPAVRPPPSDADAMLVEGAAQNVSVFPQNFTAEEIEALTPQLRMRKVPGDDGRREPTGRLVDMEVETTGYDGRCLFARWSLYERLRGDDGHVPEQWAINRAAMFVRPDDSPDTGNGQFWVPLPARSSRYFVRVALFDDTGNRLGLPKETESFR